MKFSSMMTSDRGFALVQAIFVLVVLGLLGGVMVRMMSIQTSTGIFAVQGARSYHAARSGLEWGAARARAGSPCAGSMTIDGFVVTVGCTSSLFTEATTSTTVYLINARAEFASYGSPDYVLRRVEMKVGF